MKSMTGYGRGECAQDGFKVTVEFSAVNRRQIEISVNLPRELEMLEAPIRDAINARVARGRVTARVSLHAGGRQAVGADAHQSAAGQGLRDGTEPPGQATQTSGEVTLDQLVRAPGVFQTDEELVGGGKYLAGRWRRR